MAWRSRGKYETCCPTSTPDCRSHIPARRCPALQIPGQYFCGQESFCSEILLCDIPNPHSRSTAVWLRYRDKKDPESACCATDRDVRPPVPLLTTTWRRWAPPLYRSPG